MRWKNCSFLLNSSHKGTPDGTSSSSFIGSIERGSLFKNMTDLCSSAQKKILMGIVKRKADHLRKLKYKCKERGASIKNLLNINKSIEVNNILKGINIFIKLIWDLHYLFQIYLIQLHNLWLPKSAEVNDLHMSEDGL